MPKQYPTPDESRAWCKARLQRWIDVAGPEGLVTKIESNMLAGPCDAVRALPSTTPAGEAKLFPLLDCAHPDQCACRYQATMD